MERRLQTKQLRNDTAFPILLPELRTRSVVVSLVKYYTWRRTKVRTSSSDGGFHTWEMDFVGPLAETRKDNQYPLTATDLLRYFNGHVSPSEGTIMGNSSHFTRKD